MRLESTATVSGLPRLSRVRALWRWGLWAVLAAALLILAHGCHGPDEDHELFTRWVLRF